MKKIILISIIVAFSFTATAGCAWTLHKREKDESKPNDEGTETKLQWKGPKAAIEYKF